MAIVLVGSTGGTGALNGGTLTTTIPVTVLSNDVVVAACCQGTAVTGAFSVTSSSGGAFTQILSSVTASTNGLVKLGVWYIQSSGQSLTQVVTSGTGNSSDTTNCVVMVFRGVSTSPPGGGITGTTTTGAGTTPDSPSITPPAGSGSGVLPWMAISAFAASVQDTAVTEPSSWAQAGNYNRSDNRPSTVCAATITYNSTSAFNPAAWSGLTSSPWVAATILLTPDFKPGTGLFDTSVLLPDLVGPDYVGY